MNTLRYGLRFLLRARTYTLINLLGLAFSLACCIILLDVYKRQVLEYCKGSTENA